MKMTNVFTAAAIAAATAVMPVSTASASFLYSQSEMDTMGVQEKAVVEATASAPAPEDASSPRQAKILARRAAFLAVASKACSEAGTTEGAVVNIISEGFDGHDYTIKAAVKVW